jgi:hypothetical protein
MLPKISQKLVILKLELNILLHQVMLSLNSMKILKELLKKNQLIMLHNNNKNQLNLLKQETQD